MGYKVSVVGVGDKIWSFICHNTPPPLLLSRIDDDEQLFEALQCSNLVADILVLGESLEDTIQIASCVRSIDQKVLIIILCSTDKYSQYNKLLEKSADLHRGVDTWTIADIKTLPAVLRLATSHTLQNRLKRDQKEPQAALLPSLQIHPGKSIAIDPLNHILDTVNTGILTVNTREVILSHNCCLLSLIGIEAKNIVGSALANVLPNRLYADVYRLLALAISSNPQSSHEILKHTRQREPRYLEVTIAPLPNHGGGINAQEYAVLIQDATHYYQVENELKEEKERYYITQQYMHDGVITTDIDGNIENMNPVAETLTGWPVYEAKALPLDSVLTLLNSASHERLPNPALHCLKSNHIIESSTPCIAIDRDGKEHTVILSSCAPVRDKDDNIHSVLIVLQNLTRTHKLSLEITHQATQDTLTGLINRQEFEKRLEKSVASAKQHNVRHALCYLDLDRFKTINAHAGHVAGDEVLRDIANLLQSMIRSIDTLARLGGDEFSMLLVNYSMERAISVAENIINAVREFRFVWEERKFEINVSVGIVEVSNETENAMQLLRQADLACYTAKDLGRNRIHIYRAEDNETTKRQTEMIRVASVTHALKDNRFRLYCQPIIPLSSNIKHVTRYEVLIRLLDAEGLIVLPCNFIPAIERYGLMTIIDRWVISTAFRKYSHVFGSNTNTCIAINLSGNSLNDETTLGFILQELESSDILARQVCFEITETAAINNLALASQLISELKKVGCSFALDDFGSGLSSFTYLKNLPVDFLKIDGSFVHDMVSDSIDHAMVEAINQVGHIMGIVTIAECAESMDVVDQLRLLGVDYAQGYALGEPVPMDSFHISRERYN